MKHITLLFILSFSCYLISPAFAGTKDSATRNVLDKASEKLNKAGGINVKFTVTTLIGKNPQGSTSGSMEIMGRKFVMRTPDIQTWFNGKLQWSLQADDNEVSLTEPTGTELQAINPYAFLGIYKHGFNYKMKQAQLSNGKEGYKIYLNADNKKQEIREMFIEIDNGYNLVRVSMRKGKNQWVRLVVNQMKTGQNFDDNHFTFPKSKYPDVEIIDLR